MHTVVEKNGSGKIIISENAMYISEKTKDIDTLIKKN